MKQCQSVSDYLATTEDDEAPENEKCIICYETFDDNEQIKVQTECGHANTCRQCIFRNILEQLSTPEWDFNNHEILPYSRGDRRIVVLNLVPLLGRPAWFNFDTCHSYKCPFRCHSPILFNVHFRFLWNALVIIELTTPGFSIPDVNDCYIDAI